MLDLRGECLGLVVSDVKRPFPDSSEFVLDFRYGKIRVKYHHGKMSPGIKKGDCLSISGILNRNSRGFAVLECWEETRKVGAERDSFFFNVFGFGTVKEKYSTAEGRPCFILEDNKGAKWALCSARKLSGKWSAFNIEPGARVFARGKPYATSRGRIAISVFEMAEAVLKK